MGWISWRDTPHEFIITIGSLIPGDLQLFFGQSEFPNDGQSRTVHIHFDGPIKFEDLAVATHQQPSKGQARKNGWAGPIPWGFSEKQTKLHSFYILNLDPTDPKTQALNIPIGDNSDL